MIIESEDLEVAHPQPDNTNNNNSEDSENNTVTSSKDEATPSTDYCNKNNTNIKASEKINLKINVDNSTNTTTTTHNGNKRLKTGTAPTFHNDSGEVTIMEEEAKQQQSSPDHKVPSSPTEDDSMTSEEDFSMDIMVEVTGELISEAESPIPNDILCKLKAQVRTLKRSDLEALIMDKIIEAIATHSNVGALRQKLIQSNMQRDRLVNKIATLQRQVSELEKAVRSVSENAGRDQRTRQSANEPIRFYRSVGAQVVLEGTLNSVRNLQQTQTRGDSPKWSLKSGDKPALTITPVDNNNSCGAQINSTIISARPSATSEPVSSQATASTLVFRGNVNAGLKRVMTSPALTLSESTKQVQVESQVESQTKIRRLDSDNGVTTTVMTNGVSGVTGTMGSAPVNCAATAAPNQVCQPLESRQIRNPSTAAANKALNAMAHNSNNTAIDHGVVALNNGGDLPVTSAAGGTVFPAANTSLIINGSTAIMLQPQGAQRYRSILPAQPPQFIQNGKKYYRLIKPAAVGASASRPVYTATTNLQQPRQIRQYPAAVPNQILLARGAQMSSVYSTAMTPVSISNAGQLVMSRLPVPGRPLLNALAPRMESELQQTNLVASRPGVIMTAAPQPVAKQPYTYGTGLGLRLILPKQLSGGGAGTSTRVVGRTPVENPLKKFVLPPLPPPAIKGNPGRCSKNIPPRPELFLMEQGEGIVLSWTLKLGSDHAEIGTYQIYACQESLSNNQNGAAWMRVGDVKALPLPMACNLSQFNDNNRYHFILRGVDVYNRTGPFCEASTITLKNKS